MSERARHFALGLAYITGALLTSAYYKEHRLEGGGFHEGEEIAVSGVLWPIYWSWRAADHMVGSGPESPGDSWNDLSEKPNDRQMVHVLYSRDGLESEYGDQLSFHNIAIYSVVRGFVEITSADCEYREDDARYERNGKTVIGWKPIK